MTKAGSAISTGGQALRVLPQALQLLREGAPHAFIWSAVSLILAGLAPVGIGFLTALIVQELVTERGLTPQLLNLLAAQFVIVVLASVLTHAGNYWRSVMRDQLQLHIRMRLAQHASSLDLAFFELPGNYDAFAKAKLDLGFRPFLMAYAVVYAVQQLATVLGFFGAVLAFQPWLALALALAALPTLLVSSQSATEMYNAYDLTTSEGRRATYLEGILTDDQHAKEVRLYGFADAVLTQLLQHARKVLHAQWWADRRKAARRTAADLIAVLAQYGALSFVVVQAARGEVTLGEFTLMVAALTGVRAGLSQLLGHLGDIYENSMFFQDLSRFLSQKPTIMAPPHPQALPVERPHELRLENITFAYPGADNPVFENLSFTLRAGETTALVGVNGAGKTTLVKLLTRLYDPQGGRITLDGVDIREFEPHRYRAALGVVLQDFARYQLSAHENVVFGDVWAPSDEEKRNDAAHMAGALSLIEHLPEGWNTLLGRQFHERGQDLSGGQWQRVALARALYRNASILLLDEPSSALDAEAEAELFQRYKDFAHGRTTLLITHRFNTVQMAHRIVVVEAGRIIEDGTHNSLLSLEGRYAQMFHAQADAYTDATAVAAAS